MLLLITHLPISFSLTTGLAGELKSQVENVQAQIKVLANSEADLKNQLLGPDSIISIKWMNF